MTIPIQIVRINKELPLPRYARDGDAGMDLLASESLTLHAGEQRLVKTGIAVAIPRGYVGLIHPRSGLAAKHGITVLNTPGTIDAGFRGEIQVLLWNTSDKEPFAIERGDRIAQIVFQEFVTVELFEVTELTSSERGDRGFGSTGTAAHR